MKNLSLLLVGLLCLSVVVQAGEVITNDTGEDATGLRVAFSQPVLITAFGDILTAVDPQMLAFEFVFSGGVVEPWGSHWMNFEPSTASVVEYEWLTGSPAAPQGLQPEQRSAQPTILLASGSVDDGWVRTNGPTGGRICEIAIDPITPSRLYAAGSPEGLYRSVDGGLSWVMYPFAEMDGTRHVIVDPVNPAVVYTDTQSLSRSEDYGTTWYCIADSFRNHNGVQSFVMDPLDHNTLYAAGRNNDGSGFSVLKTADGGASWEDITPNLPMPTYCSAVTIASAGLGKLFVGVNDDQFSIWNRGKVFFTSDDGNTWSEVTYGSIEDRFVQSIFVNPYDLTEVWITERSLHNTAVSDPLVFRSSNGGSTWLPVILGMGTSDAAVIGADAIGRVYIYYGHLYYTDDHGATKHDITPAAEDFTYSGLRSIAVSPTDSGTLYLPLWGSGIAYSEVGGKTWSDRSSGISSIAVNLLDTDPFDAATVYASSTEGQGVFRSQDYGETWSCSLAGIVHPYGDELCADPNDQGVIWYISDVPYIYRSENYGETWSTIASARDPDLFNFCSVYALAQGSSRDKIYVIDNGFGIFRGEDPRSPGLWHWEFLRESEVDYSYALVVDPSDDQILYSGYSRKPFQDFAMIRQSLDGGDSWTTALEIEGADAVTSVDVDESKSQRVFAASTGDHGGIWRSTDQGGTWDQPNELFDFTTIHSCATAPSDARTVYAGIWGGGTFVTRDSGETWTELDAHAAFSAAGIAVDPRDPGTVYIADRTKPVLYQSTDGGMTFEIVFDAGSSYSRLMGVTLDPLNPGRVYTIAMTTPTAMDRSPGVKGRVFRIENGTSLDVTGDLPRMPLSITVNENDPDVLYAVLHGHGVYISKDGAATWSELSGPGSGLPDSGFLAVVLDPYDSSTVYLIGGCDVRFGSFASAGMDLDLVNGIYRSTDEGLSWECLNGEIFGAVSGAVKALAFSNEYPRMILAAAENGLYVSEDRGATWVADTNLPYKALGGVAISGNHVLAMTNGAGVLRGRINSRGKIVWEGDSVLSAHVFFAQVIVDSKSPGTLYASGYPGGVFKSTDDGVTWHEANFGMPSFAVDDPLRQGYYALALAPSNSEILYLGLYGRGMYKSINGAGAWMPMNGETGTMLGQYITALTIDPQDENNVFVSTENGIFRTEDGGQTWSLENQGMQTTDVKTILFTQAGDLYAGTRGYGFYRWTGSVWQVQNPVGQWGVIWPIWADRPRYQYTSMLLRPGDSSEILVGTFPAGIYKSTDAGATWRESNVGWTLDGVFSLIARPDDPDLIYAGTYNGVNRSTDFGEHWEMWDEGWPPEQWVFRIAFDPRDSDVMYACSKNGENEGLGRPDFGGTVMKSTNAGASWFPITNGLPLDNEFYDIVVDPVNPDILYLAAQFDGMFLSEDGGASWHPWNEGLEGQVPGTNGNNVTSVLALSSDNSTLYFGSAHAGVFKRYLREPSESFVAGRKPDLLVEKVEFPVATSLSGEYAVARLILANDGGASAKDAEVEFYIDQDGVTTSGVGVLEADLARGQQGAIDVPFLVAGSEIALRVVVDPERRTLESNELNNQFEAVFYPKLADTLWSCDFESDQHGWSDLGRAWRIESLDGGNHVLRGEGRDGIYIGRPGFLGTDYILSMEFQLRSGGFMIYLRQGSSGAYVVNPGSVHINIWKQVSQGNEEGFEQLGRVPRTLSPATWYLLQIRLEDNRLTLYIDGVEVLDIIDSLYSFSEGGLYLETHGDVAIDNVWARLLDTH